MRQIRSVFSSNTQLNKTIKTIKLEINDGQETHQADKHPNNKQMFIYEYKLFEPIKNRAPNLQLYI